MLHEVLTVGMYQENCSICAGEGSREAFVIDPGDEAERILSAVRRLDLRVVRIVLTHGHLDHIGAVAAVERATGAPVSLHPGDRPLVEGAGVQSAMLGMPAPESFAIDEDLADGAVLAAAGLELEVLHTPGHTPGGCCLWEKSQGRLIAGDTLFHESIGRTDLPGGNGRQLLESIRAKLLPLPDNTVVIPGHGPETTIGHERRCNPFLQDR